MGKLVGIVQFKGKVGEVVGSKGKKSMILRVYQPDVKQANTVPQVKARVKFLTLTALSKITRKVQYGLTPYAASKGLTLTNAFSMLNAKAVSTLDPDPSAVPPRTDFEGNIDWSKVRISQGDVTNVLFRTPDLTTPGEVSVDFSDGELDGMADRSATTRRVVLAVVCPQLSACHISDPVNSSIASVTCPVPANWNGLNVEVFGFVMDFDTAEEAVAYDSYWTSGYLSLEAKATLKQMQSAARYSVSQYLGHGELG